MSKDASFKHYRGSNSIHCRYFSLRKYQREVQMLFIASTLLWKILKGIEQRQYIQILINLYNEMQYIIFFFCAFRSHVEFICQKRDLAGEDITIFLNPKLGPIIAGYQSFLYIWCGSLYRFNLSSTIKFINFVFIKILRNETFGCACNLKKIIWVELISRYFDSHHLMR